MGAQRRLLSLGLVSSQSSPKNVPFFYRRFYPKFFPPANKKRGRTFQALFRSRKGQPIFECLEGNLVRAATAAAGSGAASDARARVAPDEHAPARAVSGLPARRALTHAPPVCVSLECSSARARRRQEAREWRRENADGTRWRVLVGRRRRARASDAAPLPAAAVAANGVRAVS